MTTTIDRTAHIAAVAAHDLADELTIIANCLALLEAVDDESRYLIADATHAAWRAVHRVDRLKDYAGRQGGRASAAPMDVVVGLFDMGLR